MRTFNYTILKDHRCDTDQEEKMNVIEINDLTKDYGHGRGIFNVSLDVTKGECYGFLGPNGAGKTTTIRHLMGFTRPQRGKTTILGQDCWLYSSELKSMVGYLPGEIAFPSGMKGTEFLEYMKKMRQIKSMDYCKELLERFEFDSNMAISDMSLGLRRKLAVTTAFMHDPDILILDEPTSGLDPVMQQIFIDYILDEKKRGKTILLSSHIFNEVDATCDRISIIKDGEIVSKFVGDDLKKANQWIYRITFKTKDDYEAFMIKEYHFTSKHPDKLRARIVIEPQGVNKLIADLSGMDVADIQEIPYTLEDYFMKFYKNDKTFEGVV
jgi:ABC-2 type transport system ATP-binding protein